MTYPVLYYCPRCKGKVVFKTSFPWLNNKYPALPEHLKDHVVVRVSSCYYNCTVCLGVIRIMLYTIVVDGKEKCVKKMHFIET